VRLIVPGHGPRYTNPAPGFDPHIPHDLVHYLVEAELRLAAGVYGRAAQGGGSFLVQGSGRERTRAQRKQRKREASLSRQDDASRGDMARAERMALLCDIAWRRRHGARADAAPWLTPAPPTSEEAACVERVLQKLEPIARRWHALPIGGSLTFRWPAAAPSGTVPATQGREAMSAKSIGKKLVELCKQGKNMECIDTLYAEDVESIEAAQPQVGERVTRGIANVRAKNAAWSEQNEIHKAETEGPFPHGDDRFAVIFRYEITNKPSKQRLKLDEVALFTVASGKIVREEFFYDQG
jgi:hypothetical protein